MFQRLICVGAFAMFGLCAPVAALTFAPVDETFEQLANGDIKVSGTFKQTNRRAEEYDLRIKITVYEDDNPIPFGSGDDLLGMFGFDLWISADPAVLPMVKNATTGVMATPTPALGLIVNYMYTITNGVALGGGAADNDYFTVAEWDTVTSPVPLPPSVLGYGAAVSLCLIGFGRTRKRHS